MPMSTDSTPVQNSVAYGSTSANGSAPRIENQITGLRPNRSPIGPPAKVPATSAARKTNRWTCAFCTDTWNFSIR